MSAIQNLAWVPASVCGAVARDVDGVLSRWAAAWGLPQPMPVHCEPLAAAAPIPRDFIDLMAAPSQDLRQSFSQALFKFDAPGSAVIDNVTRRVALALTRELGETFSSKSVSEEVHGPLGHQGVLVLVELLGQRCGLLLTCAQLRAGGKLAMPRARPMPGVNLERALADVAVPLVAELGRADVNLDELMQLVPGDVLLLRETLDAPLRMVAPGSELALSAHLGAICNPPRRAVRWLAS